MHYNSLTSLADTNYSRLKYSMLEQWSVSPSLVTHASVSMSRQRSRTKTPHVRIGGDLAKITTRCSAAGLGKVRSVIVVKTTIHQTTFRQFIVCNRTVVGCLKLPGYGWPLEVLYCFDLLQLFISEHFSFAGRSVKLVVQVSPYNSPCIPLYGYRNLLPQSWHARE